MDKPLRLRQTSIGKKLLIAGTGLVWLGFLVGHMTGNLKAFLGNDAAGTPEIDVYAHFLRTVGSPLVPEQFLLWTARMVLLVCLLVHVVLVLQLAQQNRAARPIPYARFRHQASSLAARTMLVTGLLLLVFLAFHILHFTTGTVRLGAFEHGKVYHNLYHSFRQPLVAIVYLASMVLVGLHVWHGGWSLFQTWGLDSPDRNKLWRGLAWILAIGLGLGFALVPLMFLAGVMPVPPG